MAKCKLVCCNAVALIIGASTILLLARLHHLQIISTHPVIISIPVHAGKEHLGVLLALRSYIPVLSEGCGLLLGLLSWCTGGLGTTKKAHHHPPSYMALHHK